MEAITGFILAGGKSSRMGTEKALLTVRGKTMIDHAIAQARSICQDVLIVGPKETFSAYGRIVKDVFVDCGPLGGIHAALGRTQTELNFIVGVDTPFVTQPFLALLADEARKSRMLITLPRTQDGLQPLCAIYRSDFMPVADKALKEGRLKLDALFHPTTTRVLDLQSPELREKGFDSAMFDNLNTREDYERVKREKSRSAQQ